MREVLPTVGKFVQSNLTNPTSRSWNMLDSVKNLKKLNTQSLPATILHRFPKSHSDRFYGVEVAANRVLEANLDQYNLVRVVMGNPTCDLDSAACALVYAFHQYTDVKDKNQNIATLPLFNIPEREFRLKTEVLYHFQRHSIPHDLLIFRDQLDLETLCNEEKLELILVDHHTLSEEDQGLANSVIEIIDHRPQDLAWLWSGKITNIEIVGSCATLIARNLLKKKSKTLDPLICSLLRGPILMDTANLSKEVNKATITDIEVIKKLEEIGSIIYDREQEYQQLLSAKTDISRLSPSDLLIRDLKVTNGIPIPGLPILVQDFLIIDGAFDALAEFTMQYSSSVTVVMGLDLRNNVVTRDIAIFSMNPNKLHSSIFEKLNTSTNPPLNLTELQTFSNRSEYNCTLLKLGNVQASRKQVLPIITSIAISCEC